jgi:hypothetical protein
MRSQQQSLSPDIQAYIDLCETQGMPLWFEDGMFVTYIIRMGTVESSFDYSKTVSSWSTGQVLSWLETFKSLRPVCHY